MVLTTFVFENVVQPMLPATLFLKNVYKHFFQQHDFEHVVKPNGSSIIMFGNGVKPIVLAAFCGKML